MHPYTTIRHFPVSLYTCAHGEYWGNCCRAPYGCPERIGLVL